MATSDTVKQYYQNILQREPTTAELNSAVAVIDSGSLSAADFRISLVNSTEANIVEGVIRIYQAAFGRVPDKAGLDANVDAAQAQFAANPELGIEGALKDIAAAFVVSSEFTTRFGGNDISSAFIEALYQNVLGRPSDAAGKEGWMNSGLSAAQIIIGFSESPEFKADTASAIETWLNAAGEGTASYEGPLVSPDGPTGETFTLTTGIDALTGTAANDTFIGDNATTSAADTIVGGGGTDTLRLFGAATAEPNHSGIENIELIARDNTTAFDVSDNADVKSLTVDGAVTAAPTVTVGAGQSVTLENSNIGTNVATTAANTSLDVTLNKLGVAGTAAAVDFDGAALATVNMAVVGDSVVNLTNDEVLATLNLSGSGKATIDADGGAGAATLLTTVNASTATGDVSIKLEDDTTVKDVAVTGGKGNDTANFGAALTQADKFDGGEGTDTLEVTQASVSTVQTLSAANKTTLNDNLANLEVLKVTDGLTSDLDASRFDSINTFNFAGGLDGAAAGANTFTLSKVTSGVVVSLGDAADQTGGDTTLAVEITDATLAGNNSDAVTINLTDAAAGGASDAGVVNLVGVDILTIDTTQAAGGTTTSQTLDIANTSSALDTVTVVGNTALDISNVALVNSVAEVDASGMTLASAAANGLTAAIATGGTNGVKITGSGGVDNLTGGDAADVIIGGAGADNITGGAGNDVLTGGDGKDSFVFAASGAANGSDTITDFLAGTSGDVLDVSAFATPVLAANNLTLTTSSSNVSLVDESVYVLNIAGNINGKDYANADFADIFGVGNGQFSTTLNADDDDAVILVRGADETHVLYVDGNGGADTTLNAGSEVTLVGTLSGAIGELDVANFT